MYLKHILLAILNIATSAPSHHAHNLVVSPVSSVAVAPAKAQDPADASSARAASSGSAVAMTTTKDSQISTIDDGLHLAFPVDIEPNGDLIVEIGGTHGWVYTLLPHSSATIRLLDRNYGVVSTANGQVIDVR